LYAFNSRRTPAADADRADDAVGKTIRSVDAGVIAALVAGTTAGIAAS